MVKTVTILLSLAVVVYSLTCDEVLELPADAKLTLQDLKSIQQKEIVKCMAQLGKEKLGQEEAEYIWKTVGEFFGGIANIPESVLMLLHWVTAAIAPEDYANITLSNIDVIENFGLDYNLNERQLSAIADRVREDFAGKEPNDYTYYDLTALRQILCAFNRSEIEMIHPSAYKEAAPIISKMNHCSPGVLAGFATLAVQKEAFGPPASWNEATWEVIGNVAEYVNVNAPPQPQLAILPSTPTKENKTG